MKKLSLVLAMFIFIGCLFGCSGVENSDEPIVNKDMSVEEAVAAVKDTINAMKELKPDVLTNVLDAEDIEFLKNESNMAFVKNLLGKIEYSVDSSEKISDTSVLVKTTVTATDMSAFLQEAMNYVVANADKAQGMSQEEIEQFVIDTLEDISKKEDLKTVVNNVDITVNKTDGKWVPDIKDEEFNLIFGNMDKALEQLKG